MILWTGILIFALLKDSTSLSIDSGRSMIRNKPRIECPTSGTCIRKCCPLDQVWDFVKAECKKSVKNHANFAEVFFNQTLDPEVSVVTGNSCPDDTEMIPQVNHPHGLEVFSNAEFKISGRKLELDDYCVDYVDSDGILSQILFICSFRKSSDQIIFAEDYAAVEKIPVTKCCKDPELPEELPYFFSAATKSCFQLNSTNLWIPEITTAANTEIRWTEDHFNVSYAFECPSGFVPEVSVDFKFYEDGSVSLRDPKERLPANSFCVDALDDKYYPNPSGRSQVVQYCKPDPCQNGSACVKKCCPEGYIFTVEKELRCVYSEIKFGYEFRTVQNVSVPSDSVEHFVRSGSVPKCPGGKNLIDPEKYPDEDFYLLPDSGNLYIPGYPKNNEHDNYCIDNIPQNESIRLRAFICFGLEEPMDPGTALALTIYPYFMAFSAVFLVLTFLVYVLLPELRNLHGLTIMSHVFSLIVTFIGLSIIQTGAAFHDPGFCVSTAIVVHFFFLSTFTWLNVMGFDLWMTFSLCCNDPEAMEFWLAFVVPHRKISSYELALRNNKLQLASTESDGDMRPRSTPKFSSKMRRFGFYSLFAWGVPLVIVIIGQILDNVKVPNSVVTPGFGREKCWFENNIALACYFYVPVGTSISANIAFFALTAYKLYKASKEAAFATQHSGRKERFRIIVYLFVLMGVFWVLEIVSFLAQGSSGYIWIIFDIFNILTGVFIFAIFVCKRQVIQLLRKRYNIIDRFCRFVTRNHPDWNRATDPTSTVSNKYSNKSGHETAVRSNSRRKISTTSVTNVNLHDSASDLSDKETAHLNMRKVRSSNN